MNKLNLDISKYSQNELQDIFKIPDIKNSQQITSHFSTYKNNISNDTNLSLSEKDNMMKFLNNVIEKLNISLDNHPNDSSNHFFSLQNKLLNTSNNHHVIADPNIDIGFKSQSNDGRTIDTNKFSPGLINPINIKTIKKTVNIDTRFRSSYYSTSSSDFSITLPDEIKKITSMQVTSMEIPLTIYTISQALGNNFFFSDISNNNQPHLIPEGNYHSGSSQISRPDMLQRNLWSSYTSQGDEFELKKIFDNLTSSNIQLFYNINTGKCKIKNNTANTINIYFNKDICGNDNLGTPLPLNFGWLLGFRVGSYEIESTKSVESEGILSLTGPKYIYFCINDYTNAGNNHFTAAFSSSTLSSHIIQRINYEALIQKRGTFNIGEEDAYGDTINRTREYFGPVDIQRLHFQFLDEYGRVLNFNNMDWSCALTFNVLYD